jgi:hypothetical protein
MEVGQAPGSPTRLRSSRFGFVNAMAILRQSSV